MNAFVEKCNKIFGETTLHYHKFDNIDAVPENPYEAGTIDDVLFRKNWIDAVQWHMEDIIRDPAIDPVEALAAETPHRQVEPGPHRPCGGHRHLFPRPLQQRQAT